PRSAASGGGGGGWGASRSFGPRLGRGALSGKAPHYASARARAHPSPPALIMRGSSSPSRRERDALHAPRSPPMPPVRRAAARSRRERRLRGLARASGPERRPDPSLVPHRRAERAGPAAVRLPVAPIRAEPAHLRQAPRRDAREPRQRADRVGDRA